MNEQLEQRGLTVTETDLGEFIIQLAGEPPAHIVMPSLHKNRESIRELFRQHHAYDGSTEPDELVDFARTLLRRTFMTADIGITGCNFGVAETGTIVVLTNEGNGRFVTTLPRVQITIMGMERVVPTLDELDTLMTLLTVGATGQKTTSYVNFINGPRSPTDQDGPDEAYLIVVDNGRSDLLGTRFSAALHCIRCGACSNVCPVFKQTGGHAYESPYSGPIGAVISPLVLGVERYPEISYASSLCGACDEACPVNIPLHAYLIDNREAVVQSGSRGVAERWAFRAWARIYSSPRLTRLAQKLLYVGMRVSGGNRVLRRLRLPVLRGWTDTRELPVPAARSFLEQYDSQRRDERREE